MSISQQTIRGDSWGRDYLVISHYGAVAIGVKPIIEAIYDNQISMLKLLIGLQFCLGAVPGEKLISAEHAAKMLFPDVPWTYLSRTCCCVRFGSCVPPFPEGLRPEELPQLLGEANFISKLISQIKNYILSHDGVRTAKTSEIEEFIASNYARLAYKLILN